ncbi:MAG: hypothetical protein NTX17_01200 [Candidatus Eisenbacteria bacterium]|nr:hypothetical protein [Candidatus Eisenbacteria bacterium]
MGQLVLMPTLLFHRGRTYSACWGRDMYVEKEHRRNKIASRLYDRWVDDFEVALASGQSPEARELQNKYGWTVISLIHQYEKLFFRPRYLADSLKNGIYIAGKRLLAMMFSEAYRLRPSATPDVEVKVGRTFDPRVDQLWSACREQYSNICMRDHATLRWRFERHPYANYFVFEAFDKRGTYGGYCVGRIEDDTAFLIDFLTEREGMGRQMRRALIHAAESHFRSLGVVRVVCRCLSPDFEASLREAGYLPTLYTGAMAIKSRLENFPRDEWYVTAADSDLDR